MQTASAPNRLAEELPIDLGEAVSGQNYVGSLKRDWLRALDWLGRFLPVGFYYRAFYKPFGVWRLWEPMIRHMAGLGVANLESQPPYRDKQYLFCDVAVIGAGPAGLSAALEAANGGAQVLLVDENTQLGGALTYHRFDTGRRIQHDAAELTSPAGIGPPTHSGVIERTLQRLVYRSLPAGGAR